MAQGRSSAMLVTLLLCLLVLHYSNLAHAATYTVGDARGWTFDRDTWFAGKHFKAGDILGILRGLLSRSYMHFLFIGLVGVLVDLDSSAMLPLSGPVFKYNPANHNVVVVNEAGYDRCMTPQGAKVYQTGNDKIKLVRGKNFFICNSRRIARVACRSL
ncbi:hypothetical protein CRG98_033658 [Punica granatum]|uniref:Phytocyanin domain-containing protein n=1 Tax=Punica granatum TaxID=22663 RepID=A0A2I0IPT7_PUNGR|nr:hypothetical protein CRG98_033658 [Punica granatum]